MNNIENFKNYAEVMLDEPANLPIISMPRREVIITEELIAVNHTF